MYNSSSFRDSMPRPFGASVFLNLGAARVLTERLPLYKLDQQLTALMSLSTRCIGVVSTEVPSVSPHVGVTPSPSRARVLPNVTLFLSLLLYSVVLLSRRPLGCSFVVVADSLLFV